MNMHEEAQSLLPWLANGSLAGAELERVQAHLHDCAACRADLDAVHTLRAPGALSAPLPADCDVERALARLLPQLDAPASPASPASPARADTTQTVRGWRARLAANDARWLRVAAGMQCCVIAVLGALLLHAPGTGEGQPGAYRALGAAPGVQGGLVVTFKPDTPERELRRIVLENGAHIVGGPTVTGAWVLGTAEAPASVALRLRAQPAVTLAEPLGTEAGP